MAQDKDAPKTAHVRFLKAHPKLAYFKGDITELSEATVKELKLIDEAYVTPATAAEAVNA